MKSKLAITSFILSLIPIVFLLFFFIIRTLSLGESIYLGLLWIIDALFFFSVFWILISIFSFVLGIISLSKIKKENLDGKGFAVAGIFISSVILIIIIAFIIILVYRGINL